MAIITNTLLTFSAIGNREDLADIIYNISPVDTPFQKAIDKNKAQATLHEWQTDTLAAAAQNAQLEGDDITTFASSAVTTRVSNNCQIAYKTTIVSETQDAVDKAGRTKEIVYQLTKRAKELRRDVEFDMTNNQTPNAGNSTTARQLRPLCGWYTTNTDRGTGGANGNSTTAATDGTVRPLTEAMLKTGLQNTWVQGGDVDLILCGATNKVNISGFTGNATRYIDAMKEELHAAIDIYVSDWGRHRIVADRFSRARDVHLLDTNYWAQSLLRPMQAVDLAKTGDATKGFIRLEYTLEARQQASSAIIADLTT